MQAAVAAPEDGAKAVLENQQLVESFHGLPQAHWRDVLCDGKSRYAQSRRGCSPATAAFSGQTRAQEPQ
jgi:hypothetical protein